ncbi:hypothetical protein NDU88_001649 [Pleurodeles waltl]|uniref:Uncharacterized protein n=1 Tax=Pleurodeles waltl TaxID=8319 RepID=A0AAV7SZY0_PLEWA|nr:hypothetical protein NDU88_001649 [Pleurodeles waltl]
MRTTGGGFLAFGLAVSLHAALLDSNCKGSDRYGDGNGRLSARSVLAGPGQGLTVSRTCIVALLLAKRRVALHWGERAVPTKRERLLDLAYSKEQLALYAEELQRPSWLKEMWVPFTTYLLSVSEGT